MIYLLFSTTTNRNLLKTELSHALAGELDLGFLLLLGGLALDLSPELDVAGVTHVGSNATVCAEGTAAHLDGLVDLHVTNVQVLNVEVLGLGVGLKVGEEVEHELDRLHGPADLITGGVDDLGLGVATATSAVDLEGDGALLVEDLLEVGGGSLNLHAANKATHVDHLLEVGAELRGAGLAGGGRVGRLRRVGAAAAHFGYRSGSVFIKVASKYTNVSLHGVYNLLSLVYVYT